MTNFTVEQLERMLVEIQTKKPHSITGDGAEAMYAQLEKECREIEARGQTVEIPHEIPGLGE